MDSYSHRLRSLLMKTEGTTVVPGAVDVLSTVVFKRVGYEAVWAGGFMATGSLLGWPDANVIGLAEHSRFVQSIVLATDLRSGRRGQRVRLGGQCHSDHSRDGAGGRGRDRD